jgi:hypothetical protein
MEKNIGIDAFRTVIQFDDLLYQWLKKLPLKPGQAIEIIVLPVKEIKNKNKRKKHSGQISDALLDESEWYKLSQNKLAHAYSENEPEYSINLVKEPNTDYEGR